MTELIQMPGGWATPASALVARPLTLSMNSSAKPDAGARAERRELLKLLKKLASGDEVAVTRIDRLARSTFDLFAIVKRIIDAGPLFRSLAGMWADTTTRHWQRMWCRRKLTPKATTGRFGHRTAGATLDEVAKYYNVAQATISRLRGGSACEL